MSAKAAAWLGVRRTLPLTVGVVPFGMAVGIAATEAGWAPWQAIAMSLWVFAGASQLAVVELSSTGAAAWVLVVAALVINARLVLYSAGLSQRFTGHSLLRRLGLAYLVTDQAYALTVVRAAEPGGREHATAFYVGVGLTLWTAWQLGTVAGATVGLAAPASLGLDLAAPLVFLGLVLVACRGRADVVTAATAVAAYLATPWLPPAARLLAAVAAGLVVGSTREARS